MPLLTKDEAKAAAAAAGVPEYAVALNLNRILLHQPVQAKDFVQYFWDLMYEGTLDPRLRELAILRIAWTTGSAYEWTQHWHLASGLGVPAEALLAVRDWGRDRGNAGGLTEADRAILATVDDVIERGVVGAEAWARLSAALPSPSAQVEAVMAVTGWRMVSSLLLSLQVPLEAGLEAWPPDGRAPEERARR